MTVEYNKCIIKNREWLKENGFLNVHEAAFFGHYFKVDNDGFGIKIKWNYSDDTDCYYVRWQSWVGNNKDSPARVRMHPVPDRDICLECETEAKIFDTNYVLCDVIQYIQENNDRMIKLCKNNINKRLKKLKK